MTVNSWLQLGFLLLALLLLAPPLGAFMARIYSGEIPTWLRWLKPVENAVYKICGVRADSEMNWKHYAVGILLFNLAGLCALYLLQRWQGFLPFNPQALGAVSRDSSFNTAASFVTNTNWQGYGGETTMSYLTQMLGLNVQNFLSASTGMAVVVALVRGMARRESDHIGNCWMDLTRSTLYILLPLSLILALVLTSQGVVQNLSPYKNATTLQVNSEVNGKSTFTQQIAMGPAASQVAIKQLGTNGGGFFNANSAHPFENPTPLSDFLEILALLLIPAALCFTFGTMVRDKKQGLALLTAMTLVFVTFAICCICAEQNGNPRLAALGVDKSTFMQPGGNMEGKETRFGIADSGIFAIATTATSCGAVNSMHDSFTPLGGMMPLLLMQFGEVIFGGVGSGLYGMLIFAIIAVFVAGLMVGRTPEYIGKKIEALEIKMASIIILLPCAVALLVAAIAISLPQGRAAIFNSGAHGFSEVLYAATSAANNNGSAFGGLSVNNPFYNLLLGFAMLLPRFGTIIPTLAIAGSLAQKKLVPAGPGTLPTTGTLFVGLLISVVIIVGVLTFIPALALGPVVEHLQLF